MKGSSKLPKLLYAFAGVGVVMLIAAFFYSGSAAGGPSAAPNGIKESDSGVLTADWQRYDVPLGFGCGISPAEPGAEVIARPNGEEGELQTYTVDRKGVKKFVSTGETFSKLNVRLEFIEFKGAGDSIGKQYKIHCRPSK